MQPRFHFSVTFACLLVFILKIISSFIEMQLTNNIVYISVSFPSVFCYLDLMSWLYAIAGSHRPSCFMSFRREKWKKKREREGECLFSVSLVHILGFALIGINLEHIPTLNQSLLLMLSTKDVWRAISRRNEGCMPEVLKQRVSYEAITVLHFKERISMFRTLKKEN